MPSSSLPVSSSDEEVPLTQITGLQHPHQQDIGGPALQSAPRSPKATSSSICAIDFPLVSVGWATRTEAVTAVLSWFSGGNQQG